MVDWMLSWVTEGSVLPGVQARSGSPLTEWHPTFDNEVEELG
jgi:hypothetical protein